MNTGAQFVSSSYHGLVKHLPFRHDIDGDKPIKHLIGIGLLRLELVDHLIDKALSKDLAAF